MQIVHMALLKTFFPKVDLIVFHMIEKYKKTINNLHILIYSGI